MIKTIKNRRLRWRSSCWTTPFGDREALFAGAVTQHGQVICKVPRETIYALRICSDIIDHEIQLERQNILQKPARFLIAKLSKVTPSAPLRLLPSEVVD